MLNNKRKCVIHEIITNNVSTATLVVSIFHNLGAEYLANLKTNLERIGYFFELPNAIKSKFFWHVFLFFCRDKIYTVSEASFSFKKKTYFRVLLAFFRSTCAVHWVPISLSLSLSLSLLQFITSNNPRWNK